MRKVSVSELHINTSAVVRQAGISGPIVIERRGFTVAELHPLPIEKPELTREQKEQITANMKKLWARMPQLPDSTSIRL